MTYDDIWRRLASIYDTREAKAITRVLLEDLLGLTFADILCGATEHISDAEHALLNEAIDRLLHTEPLQYVLGKCQFAGHEFKVNPSVLIPRPETEWLVDEITGMNTTTNTRILDIGTGSGCIAISIALGLKDMPYVEAWDISREALDVARANAAQLDAKVTFCERDALHLLSENHVWDIIVSNPPYICQSEVKDMADNVTRHEPHRALFVPDDDALVFYRHIATYAIAALRQNGVLLFECNTLYAQATCAMLLDMGFKRAHVVDDCFGKPRFVKAFA